MEQVICIYFLAWFATSSSSGLGEQVQLKPCLNTAWNCPAFLLRGWFTWKCRFYLLYYRSHTFLREHVGKAGKGPKSFQNHIFSIFHEFIRKFTPEGWGFYPVYFCCCVGQILCQRSFNTDFVQIWPNKKSGIRSRSNLGARRLLVWMSAGVWLKG